MHLPQRPGATSGAEGAELAKHAEHLTDHAHAQGAAGRSIPNGLRAETGCQRKPTMALGLSLRERPDEEQIKRF